MLLTTGDDDEKIPHSGAFDSAKWRTKTSVCLTSDNYQPVFLSFHFLKLPARVINAAGGTITKLYFGINRTSQTGPVVAVLI
jgi:hypothetical protein